MRDIRRRIDKNFQTNLNKIQNSPGTDLQVKKNQIINYFQFKAFSFSAAQNMKSTPSS